MTTRRPRRADRAALAARAAAVMTAAATLDFQTRVNAQITGSPSDWIRASPAQRKQVGKILDELGIDHRQIELTVKWIPAVRKLHVWAKPGLASPPAEPKSKLRAIGPGEQPAKP